MKQFRWLTALVVGAFLLAACGSQTAGLPAGSDGAISTAAVPTVPVTGVVIPSPPGYDLINGDVALVNGALWFSGVGFKVGTGVIDPFLTLQSKGTEQGFNTDNNNFAYDQKRPRYTNALPLTKVSEVKLGDIEFFHDVDWTPVGGKPRNGNGTALSPNTVYREIVFDANENNSGSDPEFSIEEFELWVCRDPKAPSFRLRDDFADNAKCKLAYDFAGEVGYATTRKTSGSGKTLDYFILIPDAAFRAAFNGNNGAYNKCGYGGTGCDAFVILWSTMGDETDEWRTDATFEEFSTLRRAAPRGSISGLKYEDLNADGTRAEGEPGLVDWEIELYLGGVLYANTFTDADGFFQFLDLPPGEYEIREVCPVGEGWYQSEPTPTNGCGSGVYPGVAVTSAADAGGYEFGNYQYATVTGFKWYDMNGNGLWDDGEPPLAGWTIRAQGTAVSDVTAADGSYALSLPPGSYTIEEDCSDQQSAQVRWYQTFPAPTNGCGSGVHLVTLVSGAELADKNFGNNKLVFKGETAWAANGDEALQLAYSGLEPGNWATYVEYAEKTTTLFAGRTMNAGSVTFSAVADGKITITVNLGPDWGFEDVSENLKVQDYATEPSGNPAPGLFAHKKTCPDALDPYTCSIVVPANAFYGVHVNVGTWVQP